MKEDIDYLVVGAGASGLAFALQCAQQNIPVRIIEKRPENSRLQKATGVAQGVWKQLQPFGIFPEKLGAIPMRNFAFYDDAKLVSNVPVPLIDDQPPAYLYPQHKLEEQLENLLNQAGVFVEYGVSFYSFVQRDKAATVYLSHLNKDALEACDYSWVIGADGAHSAIRAALEVPFIGKDYPECWSVAGAVTQQWPQGMQAKLDLHSNGIGFFLSQPSPGVVQGILNAEGAGKALKAAFSDADLLYERDFTVSLRRVESPRINRFWLIGDAAHVQSPVGGQGLNLAI